MTLTVSSVPAAAQLPPWRQAVFSVSGVLLLGLLIGGLWRVLAPLAEVQQVEGGFALTKSSEVAVAQDGWLALIFAVLGIGLAIWQGMRGREPSLRPALALACALAAAGIIAWQVGEFLGPAELADQVAAGVQSLRTPLKLHTPSVLLVGPLMFCATRSLTAFLTDDPGPRTLGA